MASLFSPYSNKFPRLGACVPHGAVADPRQNADNVLSHVASGDKALMDLMVFAELGISVYAIDDLLFQDAVLDEVERQLDRLISASCDLFPVFAVGAPLRHRGHLSNCGIVIHRGQLLGVVPKVYLPNYREFYERRQLTSGEDIVDQSIEIAGHEAPFGRDLLFAAQGTTAFTFHVEICEDLWVPHPPRTDAALAGAEILLNLSASSITIGKAEMRRLLCASQSSRCIAAYAYSAAGAGESTTDLAWDGQAGIFECSDPLAETERFSPDPATAVAGVAPGPTRPERMPTSTFGNNVLAAAHKRIR